MANTEKPFRNKKIIGTVIDDKGYIIEDPKRKAKELTKFQSKVFKEKRNYLVLTIKQIMQCHRGEVDKAFTMFITEEIKECINLAIRLVPELDKILFIFYKMIISQIIT